MTTNNQNTQNGRDEVFTPTVRSSYRFFNSDSEIDKTSMSFNFWNGLLKITINPIIVKEGSANKVDTDNHVDIYLSPAKAAMLLHTIRTFRQNPDAYKNIGVSTNKGAILIGNGNIMFGHGNTVLIIYLIDNDNGDQKAEAAYEFNSHDAFGIANYGGGSDFERYTGYSKDIELDQFETLLKAYIEASTNAIAATVMDANKYNDARMFSFIKDARDKLGIPKNSGGGYNNRSSFFNNNSGNGTVSSSSPRTNDTSSYDDVVNDIASIMD